MEWYRLWNDPDRPRRWLLLPATLAAVVLCLVSLGNLRAAHALQSHIDRDYAEVYVGRALREPITSPREAALRDAVNRLVRREDLGVLFLTVRDAAGVLRASAGRYENLDVGWLPRSADHLLRDWLYERDAQSGHGLILADDGKAAGSFDYTIANGVQTAVHDAAVSRLLWSGWLGVAAGLVMLAWLAFALRRQLTEPPPASALLERMRMPPRTPGEAVPGEDADLEGEAALRSRMGLAMDQLRYGVLVADRDARVRHLNKVAEQLTGWPLGDARTRLVYSVFHAVDEHNQPLLSAAEACLKEGREVAVQECALRGRDGSLLPIEMMAGITRDREGVVDGTVMLFRDIGPRHRRMEELKRQSRLSQGVIDHLEEGLLTTDHAGVVHFANARALRMFGYAREELEGVTITKLMPVPFLNTPSIKLMDYAGARNARKLPKVVGWRKDATTFPAELQVQPMSVGDDNGLIVIVRDISERLRGENLATRLGRLLDSALEEVYIFDAQSLYFLEVNRGARKNLGYRQEQLARMTPLTISSHLEEAEFLGYLSKLRGGDIEHLTYRAAHRRADGTEYPVEVRLNFSREEEPPVFMAIAVDISERVAAEEKLKHLAHHDALTGLPSRSVLYDRLNQSLLAASRSNRMVAVYFVDLDLFKNINDSYGHEVGDAALKCVSERLKAQLRAADTVARLAGDEFVIIATGIRGTDDAEALAQKVVESFRHRLDIPGHEITMSVSVGVAIYPLDEGDADALLRHADAAMYMAKQAGRGCYRLFSSDIDPLRRRRLDLEREIHTAVALNQFHITLAPVISQRDAVAAALVDFYWEHPRSERVGSRESLRAATRAGLLADLELWLICNSCAELHAMRQAGAPMLPAIVSISGWQLRESNFGEHVLTLMERFEVQPGMLILALTQDGMTEAEAMPERLVPLVNRGVRFALRDFSGGFEALNRSGAVPFDLILMPEETAARAVAESEVARRLRAVLESAAATARKVVVTSVASTRVRTHLEGLGNTYAAGPLYRADLGGRDGAQWLAAQRAEPL
ncbi:MAG TPA: diguanylate cyclase [Nevskiaceae bacterium]|nr:diguanylate cyclase [Nevskiaceae bacterium]